MEATSREYARQLIGRVLQRPVAGNTVHARAHAIGVRADRLTIETPAP